MNGHRPMEPTMTTCVPDRAPGAVMRTRALLAPIRRRAAGFTLTELLLAVTIVGLVTAFAVPNYTDYVRRAARTDAQLVLQQAANHLERIYAECNSYTVRDASTTPPCTATFSLPTDLQRSPIQGTKRYDISINARTAQSYELVATPLNTTDGCGTYTLRSTGERLVSGALGVTACWRR